MKTRSHSAKLVLQNRADAHYSSRCNSLVYKRRSQNRFFVQTKPLYRPGVIFFIGHRRWYAARNMLADYPAMASVVFSLY